MDHSTCVLYSQVLAGEGLLLTRLDVLPDSLVFQVTLEERVRVDTGILVVQGAPFIRQELV